MKKLTGIIAAIIVASIMFAGCGTEPNSVGTYLDTTPCAEHGKIVSVSIDSDYNAIYTVCEDGTVKIEDR